MAFCASCGGQMNGAFCGTCGAQAGGGAAYQAPVATASSSPGLQDNVAAALAYLFIPAIIFLVVAPYNQNKLIRFHAFQGLFLGVLYIVLSIGLTVAINVMVWFLPVSLIWLLGMGLNLYSLLSLALTAFLIYKAYNNEKFMIPGIGQLAQKQA
jgi:uncharacterized membrane protein